MLLSAKQIFVYFIWIQGPVGPRGVRGEPGDPGYPVSTKLLFQKEYKNCHLKLSFNGMNIFFNKILLVVRVSKVWMEKGANLELLDCL